MAYHRTWIIGLLAFLLPCHSLWAQSTKSRQQPENKGGPTFKLPVDVIVVSVVVTDKDGNPVTDLTQRDFKVFEDGKPQAIQTFSLESYAPIQSSSATPSNPVSRGSESPDTNNRRPHMISIIIDDFLSIPDDHFLSVTNAITKFIETDMGLEDQIEIFSLSERIRYPFSNDKQALLEQTRALLGTLNSHGTPDSAAVQETLQQNEEYNYRSSSLLDALVRHIRSLKHFEAAKDVVFFSAGFLEDPDGFMRQELQEVIDQALRAGVVLNTIDARGLYNPYFVPPEKQSLSGLTVARGILEADAVHAAVDRADAKAAPLSRLADETGGIFYHYDNDLYRGLQKVSIPKAVYYLTYATALHKPDDRYHHIKLEISRPGLKLTYRNGYFTPKEELTFQRRKREDILEAIQTPGNFNEIPIALGYNCDPDDDSHYDVSFLVTSDIRRLHFLNEDSRHRNVINLVVVAFDENDHYIDGLDKSIDFRLSDESYENLRNEGLRAKVTFKLTFGRYRIKTVVREGVEGRMGSLTRMIEVP
jgi:VWFA-related protein